MDRASIHGTGNQLARVGERFAASCAIRLEPAGDGALPILAACKGGHGDGRDAPSVLHLHRRARGAACRPVEFYARRRMGRYREERPRGALGSTRVLLRSGPGVLAAKVRRHSLEQMIIAACCLSMVPGLGWRSTLKCS